MRVIIAANALLSVVTLSSTAWAYEVVTHARISERAVERSNSLGGDELGPLLERLGLDRLPTDRPFRIPPEAELSLLPQDAYTESGRPAAVREPQEYERRMICPILTGSDDCRGPTGEELSGENDLSLTGWILRGAIREDDLLPANYEDEPKPDLDTATLEPFTRVFGHFYDPVFERPLVIGFPGGCLLSQVAPPVAWPYFDCARSIDWGLGYEDALAESPEVDFSSANRYSMSQAFTYLFSALTSRGPHPETWEVDSYLRLYRWASVFKSLGHVIHLIQDAGQPQHTRNDNHSPLTTTSRRAIESYTEARALGGSTFVGPEAREFIDFYGSTVEFPELLLDTPAPYPVPTFARSVRFFTTYPTDGSLGKGIADYSNRGFFTDGTLPGYNDYPLPPPLSEPGYTVVGAPRSVSLGPESSFPVTFTEMLRAVPDYLSPAQVENVPPEYEQYGGRIPLVTRGAFSDIVQRDPLEPVETISLENLTAHVDYLLPRAVAYSAGMLDYFFRGQLEVLPPDDGIISVADQGDPHQRNAWNYPQRDGGGPASVFGFETAKLRVRNLTSEIDDGGPKPQTMPSGELYAVARYHRNPCYVPEMDGEWTNDFLRGHVVPNTAYGCSVLEDVRTGYQDVSVSAPIPISEGDLDSEEGREFEFVFEDTWIPVSATDLFLQVIYFGEIGGEPFQVATGMLDVSEPYHFLALNMTDYYQFDGTLERPEALRDEPELEGIDIDPETMAIEMTIDGRSVLSLDEVEPGRFIRLAVLADDGVHSFSVTSEYERTEASDTVAGQIVFQTERQAPTEYGSYDPAPFLAIRGAAFNATAYFFKFFRSTGDIPWDLDPLVELRPLDADGGTFRRPVGGSPPQPATGASDVAGELYLGSYGPLRGLDTSPGTTDFR